MRRAGLLILVTVLAGCGAVEKRPAVETSECGSQAQDVQSSFRPLPKGFKYTPMPEAQMEAIRKSAGEAFVATEAKLVAAGSVPQGVVVVLIPTKSLADQQDEDDFMRGFASTFGEGVSPEPVDLPGGAATRMEGGPQTAFVQVRDEGCRVVSVAAADDRAARRVAVSVLR